MSNKSRIWRLLGFDLRVGDRPFQPQQVVGLGLHDVAAEGGGQGRLVGLHVEHGFDGVPEVADPGPLQIVQHLGDVAPLGDLGVGHGSSCSVPRITGGGLRPMRMATPVNSGTEQKSSLHSCM